jgi:hypothetical protein
VLAFNTQASLKGVMRVVDPSMDDLRMAGTGGSANSRFLLQQNNLKAS